MGTLYLILFTIVGIAAVIFTSRWLLRRAIPKVIEIFRQHNATSAKNAKTLDELGLKLPDFMGEIFSRRDYKRYALRGMMTAGIIQVTEDGKVYFSEEKFLDSKLNKSQSSK